MKSKNYMLLVVGLLLIFITSVSAAPLKLPASSKAPAGLQKPIATQSMTPATVQPVGGTLTITSIPGMPNLKAGDHVNILYKAANLSTTSINAILLRNNAPIGNIGTNIYAPSGIIVWEVGKITSSADFAIGTGYSIRLCTSDNSKCTDSGQLSISAVSSPRLAGTYQAAPSLSSGAYQAATKTFALIAPNGGESWPLGSTQQITWSPGDVSGNVRLDLYKDGTEPANRVGVITGNTLAAAGKYSWKVGSFLGGEAYAGGGYMVVVSSYTPEKKDASNAFFNIVPFEPLRAASAKKVVSTAGISTGPIESISLTYPRRADLWRKGSGYKIKWKSNNLSPGQDVSLFLYDSKNILVTDIVQGAPNSGEYYWVVPMTLPETEKFYHVKIMAIHDKVLSDTVGPVRIEKTVISSAPKIEVVSTLGANTLGAGTKGPIRWTSTCGTNPDGPAIDFFTIELLAGNKVDKLLLEAGYYQVGGVIYDGESPEGVHNWHWDWDVDYYQKPQTYQIRVTNMYGNCTGLSKPFKIVSKQEQTNSVLSPTMMNTCTYQTGQPYYSNHMGQNGMSGETAPAAGFMWDYKYDGGNLTRSYGYVKRGVASFGPKWYKGMGTLLSAKLVIKRTWQRTAGANTNPNLQGVALLTGKVPCPSGGENVVLNPAVPFMPGTLFPLNGASGDTWEIDLTDAYRFLISSGKDDFGVMIYSMVETLPPQCNQGGNSSCLVANLESYRPSLHVRFAKDIVSGE